jgi:ribosome maturation factor RimP
MSQAELNEKIRQEFAAVAQSVACELLDCQFRGGVLRLVIDRPAGVTIDDCQRVSKQLSALLDVEDFGLGRYVLEVSSPGLDRKLYGPEDYERFSGSKVRMTWKEPEMAHKKTVVGTLAEYSPESDEVRLVSSERGDTYTVSIKNVLLTRLEPEI